MTQGRFTGVDRSLEELATEALDILADAKEAYQPVGTYALVSGGNDSATLLQLVHPYVDAAVHIRTGIGIPETSAFVRELCAGFGVKLIELVTPPEIYRDIVLGNTRKGEQKRKGFPGPPFHYVCYHRLKGRRLQDFQRDQSKRGQRVLLVSGVRQHESDRRMKQIAAREHEGPRGRLTRTAWANPIVHWTSHEMVTYRRAFDVPRSPVADAIHVSGECLCGAFAHPGELDEIAYWYPDTAAYIRSLEAEARAMGKPFSEWGHGRGEMPKEAGPLCSDCQWFGQEYVVEG